MSVQLAAANLLWGMSPIFIINQHFHKKKSKNVFVKSSLAHPSALLQQHGDKCLEGQLPEGLCDIVGIVEIPSLIFMVDQFILIGRD